MISIETGHNSIKLSLCHICGIDYPKPSLPSHVRRYTKSTLLSCIKTVSRPGSRVPSAKPIRRVSVNSTFTLVDKVTEKRSFSGPVSINSIPKVPVDHESVEERVDLSDHLIPCDICNRKFMKTRLVSCPPSTRIVGL